MNLSNGEVEPVNPSRLSELLSSSWGDNGNLFLGPVQLNGDLQNYSANFQSPHIIDGWKSIKRQFWYHPLHQISSYLGRFPPALARYFISKFSQENEVVYDPFSGSGTVVLESNLLNRQSIGNDIFIYAYTLSRAKARPVSRERFESYLKTLEKASNALLTNIAPREEPLFERLEPYFHPETLKQILAVREALKRDTTQPNDLITFTKALICGILHGDSKMFLSVQTKDTWSASPEYVRRYVAEHGLTYEQRDVFECLLRKADRVYRQSLPEKQGVVYRCSITNSRVSLPSNFVDLIVTSPPYLTVRNYALDNWLRVWFLGGDRLEEHSKMLHTSEIDTYERAMKLALRQMYRVLKPNKACVIVAANVVRQVNGNPIYFTCNRLARIAREVGFNVITIFDDEIHLNKRTSQLFNTRRYMDMIDSVPRDSVLILAKGNCPIYDKEPVEYMATPLQSVTPEA